VVNKRWLLYYSSASLFHSFWHTLFMLGVQSTRRLLIVRKLLRTTTLT